jgi:hypothetical protein
MLNKETYNSGSNKKIIIQLQKYKKIMYIYFTPKNQMWGILSNSKKKCILRKVVGSTELDNFLKNKNIISYEGSKAVNKKHLIDKEEVSFIGGNLETISKSTTICEDPKQIEIFNMEGLNFLKEKVLDNSIDLILTDPPYIISKNSGFEELFKKKKNLTSKMDKKYAFQSIFN